MKRLLPFLAVLLSSCIIPYHQEVPVGESLTGRVVDAQSGAAIAGARVRYQEIPGWSVFTEADGTFQLQPQVMQKTYWMPPAPIDPPPWFHDANVYYLVIEASGYRPREFFREKSKTFFNPGEDPEVKKGPEYYLFPLTK
jgi:hypothetical protein